MYSSWTRRTFLSAATCAGVSTALRGRRLTAQTSKSVDAVVEVFPKEQIATIAPEIYGHFIEQLGGVIYDGVWVGEGSRIPNEHGIRKSFLAMMRSI